MKYTKSNITNQTAEISLDWEVDDGGVLFDEEGVLSEALDVHEKEFGDARQLKFLVDRVLVGLVLLGGGVSR